MNLRLATLAGVLVFGALPARAGEAPSFSDHTAARYSSVGLASWYGSELHGHATANGEIYDMRALSAAHRTMPLPSYARVTNLANGRSIVVRVNDRGPFVRGRIVDVSARAASLLEIKGVAKVRLDYIGKAPPPGSDGPALLASLQTGGHPAGTAVASAHDEGKTVVARTVEPVARAASDEGRTAVARDEALAFAGSSRLADPAAFGGLFASDAGKTVVASVEPTAFASPAAVRVAEPAAFAELSVSGGAKTEVAKSVEPAAATEPRSPYGDLMTSPFLMQASARP